MGGPLGEPLTFPRVVEELSPVDPNWTLIAIPTAIAKKLVAEVG